MTDKDGRTVGRHIDVWHLQTLGFFPGMLRLRVVKRRQKWVKGKNKTDR